MKCYINGVNFIKLLFLLTELLKFEIKKINVVKFYVHIAKPYFLTYVDVTAAAVTQSREEVSFLLECVKAPVV